MCYVTSQEWIRQQKAIEDENERLLEARMQAEKERQRMREEQAREKDRQRDIAQEHQEMFQIMREKKALEVRVPA